MASGLDRLLALPRFSQASGAAYAPGQERVRALLAAMGDPHHALPVIHIAGTNGKGSTAAFVSAIGTASGLRVGLFASPSLLHIADMIRLDGVPQTEALARGADRWKDASEASGATFFETMTALALWTFAQAGVDLAVVEVGLGGRDDATAVVRPLVTAVTHIGLDHTDLLGGSPEAIAEHKAGIGRPGIRFLHGLGAGPARRALEAEASQRGADIERVRETVSIEATGDEVVFATPEGRVGPVRLGLPGPHQQRNAALALRAFEHARWLGGEPPAPEAAARGLRDVVRLSGLRGRAEPWSGDPRIVLDVAHNADGWRAALDATPARTGRLWALVGAMADKDVGTLRHLLRARGARILAAGLASPRALAAGPLAKALGGAEAVGSVAAGLERFRGEAGPSDRLLVTGSHLTVAEAINALEPEAARTSTTTAG